MSAITRRALLAALGASLVTLHTRAEEEDTPPPIVPENGSDIIETPETEEDDPVLDFEGVVAKAERGYLGSLLDTTGPAVYGLAVYLFETEELAEQGFVQAGTYFEQASAGIFADAEDGTVFSNPKPVSVPDVGSDQAAVSFKIAGGVGGVISFQAIMLRAWEGRVLHVWVAAGIMDAGRELMQLAEKAMRFDLDNEDDVSLDEVPPGYTLEEEDVTRP